MLKVSSLAVESEIPQDGLSWKDILKVSSLAVESEIPQDGLSWKDILKVSSLAVEVEIPQESLYVEPEVNSFNIYLGATPITKIYQGSTEITNTKY